MAGETFVKLRMVAEAESFVEPDVLDSEIVYEDILEAEFVV